MTKIVFHAISIFKQLLIAYVIICLFVWAAQRYILYLPNTNIKSPITYGLSGFEDIRIQSDESTQVQAWYHKPKNTHPTIIYFHGNAGHLGNRARYFKLLSDSGFGVLALSYRGYGASQGSPSEKGFYQDARATINYAIRKLHLKPNKIIIYGESIGTGVAVQMATEFSSAALILQSPYTSMLTLAADRYPWLPIRLLLKDKFDSASKIENINTPVLLIHGEKDKIVPVRFGRELFEKINTPKKAMYLAENGHLDIDYAFVTNEIIQFCKSQKIIALQ